MSIDETKYAVLRQVSLNAKICRHWNEFYGVFCVPLMLFQVHTPPHMLLIDNMLHEKNQKLSTIVEVKVSSKLKFVENNSTSDTLKNPKAGTDPIKVYLKNVLQLKLLEPFKSRDQK